jgi:hypothetical protein
MSSPRIVPYSRKKQEKNKLVIIHIYFGTVLGFDCMSRYSTHSESCRTIKSLHISFKFIHMAELLMTTYSVCFNSVCHYLYNVHGIFLMFQTTLCVSLPTLKITNRQAGLQFSHEEKQQIINHLMTAWSLSITLITN